MCAPTTDEDLGTKKVELSKSCQDTADHPSSEAGRSIEQHLVHYHACVFQVIQLPSWHQALCFLLSQKSLKVCVHAVLVCQCVNPIFCVAPQGSVQLTSTENIEIEEEIIASE